MKKLLAAMLLATAAPALAAPSDDLARVIDDHWAWWLATNPEQATALGERRYDDKISDVSLAEADRQAAAAQGFLKRLNAVPDSGLSTAERVNKAILARLLSEQVEANGFGARQVLFTSYYSWHQGFASLAENVPLRTRADFDSYLARLAQYPALNREAMRITRAGVAAGYAQPCVAIGGIEKSITGVITASPEDSRFYAPFKGERPGDISAADWAAMQARARTLVTDVLNPEYRAFHEYFVKEYLPKCRQSVGASALPDGAAWYAFRVRQMTTTNLSPEEIHQIGLREVARIRAEMDAAATQAGFASRAAFIAALKSDPRYFAKTPEELLAAAALEAKRHDGLLPRYFSRLPRLPYGIRAIPAETAEGTTTAYYGPGAPPAGIAGTYFVNTSKLPQRPLWELPALTAHEAVPGHHLQIALQQELELPSFRKYAAGFTAYVEGWALYTERLGIEMGLYDTPEKTMGRLSYEMWRACRLVVDTGLHAKGWSKARAVAFMKDNTALTDANIDAEVNRYISWPGQALGYKMGELKIRALRARAEAALGTKFDLRAFHDVVLGQGAVPLDVLEAQVDAWIATQK
ncbi:DUF885 family protein [Sphingomonas sp.]|uniref:DUF885 domain-containing protein n=1 Tax=Sphingomonas sp. TaxID=28214 RepID=UPI001D901F29|nr:DUF885 domain-containing protein [Sphingomonas sp.]MBX9795334.1 DUF885 domain-containing protein [Sphingomonas sp.]